VKVIKMETHEMIEALEKKTDVVYIGNYFDKLPSSHGFELGSISGINYLYVAPRGGLYSTDELNNFMDGLFPQMQSIARKTFRKDRQLRVHGSNPEGIFLGHIDYADVIGKRILREERIIKNGVPLDYATEQAVEKGNDVEIRYPNRTLAQVVEDEHQSTDRTITYSREEPLIRIVRIEPYPDERIARNAKEGILEISRGAYIKDADPDLRSRGAFISNFQLLRFRYRAANMAKFILD